MTPASPPTTVRHSAFERAVIIAVGLLFALFGAAFVLLAFLAAFVWAPTRAAPIPAAAWFFAFGCALLVAYGGILMYRGVRGVSNLGPRQVKAAAFLGKWVVFLVNIPFAIGMYVVTNGRPVSSAVGSPLIWYWFVGVGLIPIAVALHELGHVVAGRCVGIPARAVRVGRVVVRRDSGRWRLSWDPNRLLGLDGFAAFAPPADELDRVAFAWSVVGGPAANAASAAVCWALARMGDATPTTAAHGSALLFAACFVNVAVCALAVVPHAYRGVANDGATLIAALSARSPAAELAWRVGILALRKRPRDWKVTTDQLLEAAGTDARLKPWLVLAALSVALDKKDIQRARSIVDAARAESVLPHASAAHKLSFSDLEFQAVMMEALLEHNRASAREHLARLGPNVRFPFYLRLAEAAVLCSEGRLREAADALAEWQRSVDASGLDALLRAGNQWALEIIPKRLANVDSTVASA